MPTTYITNTALEAKAKDRLGNGPDEDLPQRYASVVSDANTAAYQDIRRALLGRGFTVAQIDAWDDRVEFNRDLGLYWIFAGQPNQSADDTWIEKLNRREELLTIPVLISGEVVEPGGTSAKTIGWGLMDDTNDAITMDTRF